MKLVFIFFVTFIIAVSHQQSLKQILGEWRKLAAPHLNRCMCQSKVNPDLIEGAFQYGEIPNDPCFKCNVRCWNQGIGIMNPAGKVNLTVYGSIFGITEEIVEKCGYIDNVDICQKSYDLLVCAYNMVAARAAANTESAYPETSLPSTAQIWNGYPNYFFGQYK